MSRPYLELACPCKHCTVANTPAVRVAGTTRRPGYELHGRDAADYLRAQAGNLERVGAIAERLRSQFKVRSSE